MTIGTARVAAVAASAGVTTTLIQLVPANNNRGELIELGISFISTTTTDAPVTVDLLRQTTAGTASALTVVKDDETDSKTLNTTARQSFSAEPTASDILRSWQVTPIGGLWVIQFPMDGRPAFATNRLGLRINAPQAQTATAYLTFAE